MTIGEDAAGEFADAALLGVALERGGTGSQHHDETCANCGAALAGRYCQVCGQRGHVHRSVLHLAEEFFHGLFHLDGKIWRTAPLLLFRPGALTRRYVEGQRVRYVSPIALFLFSVFLMFLAVATIDSEQAVQGVDMPAGKREELKKDLSQAREQLDHATGNAEALGAAKSALDKAEKTADEPSPPEAAKSKDDDEDFDLFAGPLGLDWRAQSKKMAKSTHFTTLGGPEVEKRVRASLADPDLLVYKLRSAASEYSFMLVPFSVPFLWLMFFWRRRVYLYDHMIFSLHSLSFMALFVTAFIAAMEVHLRAVSWAALFIVPPVHMFFHLKGTYRLGIFGALWRTCFLSLIAIIVLVLYVVAILILGLVH
jgi:hypothetical protein